jgi:membrane-bound serine protease (ClpP class)
MSVETLFLIAIVFLAMELIITSMGVLGFLGFIAFMYGLYIMHMTGMDSLYGIDFEIVAALGLSIFIIFAIGGFYAYRAFGKKIETGIESMLGDKAEVVSWKNGKGKIVYEGEDWRAQSEDDLTKGDNVKITGYKKLTLTVEKEN